MKKERIHGGDIYGNRVSLDFSVNTNPLGIPAAVEAALHRAVEKCIFYPDREVRELKRALSRRLSLPEEYLLFGNGASELFMAIVHGIRPKRTVIPVPSFSGYEYAAASGGGEILFCPLSGEREFAPGEELGEALSGETELVFLGNPNNPTGRLLSREYLGGLLTHCRDRNILVVLDESFIGFCGEEASQVRYMEEYGNLLIVRAFTKIFAIPGVRLGYLLTSESSLKNKIEEQLPEWNVSVFAQEAGRYCVEESAFLRETVDCVRKERGFLTEGLQRMGLTVVKSDANFILFRGGRGWYERLLEQGILIRDCGSFRGLSGDWYRIAVRSRRENERLLAAMEKIKEEADIG